MAVGMINGTSAFGRLRTFQGWAQFENVPPNNGLQSDAPRAARA